MQAAKDYAFLDPAGKLLHRFGPAKNNPALGGVHSWWRGNCCSFIEIRGLSYSRVGNFGAV